jgi:hypothetical protein
MGWFQTRKQRGPFPPEGLHALRPSPSVLRRSAIAAAAFLVPSTVVLYVLTVPNGPWIFVFATELTILIGLLFAWIGFRRAGIWVGPTGIAERGFFGAERYVPVTEIGSIVFVDKFEARQSDPIPQLFVCDSKGRQLIRMRGQFWSRRALKLVSETLPVPVTEVSDPVTAAELLDEYPGLLYWFERHPALAASIFTATVIVGGVLLYLILGALGITTVSALRDGADLALGGRSSG